MDHGFPVFSTLGLCGVLSTDSLTDTQILHALTHSLTNTHYDTNHRLEFESNHKTTNLMISTIGIHQTTL